MIEPFFPEGSTEQQVIPQQQTQRQPVAKKSENQEKKKIARPSISGLGVSISALTKEADNPAENKEAKTVEIFSESFTPIELLNQWKLYAESLTEEHHLKNTMLNCLPDLQSRDLFEVVVNNPVQEQRLTDNAVPILSTLRESLRNSNIQMKVRVSIENEKKLGFTSLEKFNLMLEQNDSLKRLKDEFGLELM